jgi:hypothetical protein
MEPNYARKEGLNLIYDVGVIREKSLPEYFLNCTRKLSWEFLGFVKPTPSSIGPNVV